MTELSLEELSFEELSLEELSDLDFSSFFDSLLPPNEFLEEQKNVKKYTTSQMTVEAGVKAAEPTIALLEWKN